MPETFTALFVYFLVKLALNALFSLRGLGCVLNVHVFMLRLIS